MIAPRAPRCPDCRRFPCECGLLGGVASVLRGICLLVFAMALLTVLVLIAAGVAERRAGVCDSAPAKRHYDRLPGQEA